MNRRFPLQPVLAHRERQEDQRQLTLALATIESERAQAAVLLAQQRYAALIAQLDHSTHGGMLNVQAIQTLQLQAARTIAQIATLQQACLQAEAVVTAAQTAATSASQDRMVIEKLRDAHATQIRHNAAHVESERLGELSLSRWQRQQRTHS